MEKLTLENIKKALSVDFEFKGNSNLDYVDNFKSIIDADEHSIVWCSPDNENKLELISRTASKLIICDSTVQLNESLLEKKRIYNS